MKRAELQQLLIEVDEARQRYGHLPLYLVAPDWCSSGIWLPEKISSIATGPNLIIDNFPISEQTRKRLAGWQALFDSEVPERIWVKPGSRAIFLAEGLNVAIAVSTDIGEDSLIEYHLGDQCLLFRGGKCVAICPIDPTTSGLWEGTDD